MKELFGKVILITGAGKGTGRALTGQLAARGAIIAANDISPLNLDSVVDEVIAAGGQARAYVHDVAKKVAVQAMVNQVMDDFGRLDALVNCATVEPPAPLLDLDEWDLHRVFEVNAIGTFLMMQSVGRVMRQAGSGVIVNVLKLAPEAPASYLASRGGIAALSQRADEEWKPYGIRVWAVSGEDAPAATLRLLEQAWNANQ
jgi:NAD(P)-dependent dehydrogenase (short-subunit alcohol dehydrogenase family)